MAGEEVTTTVVVKEDQKIRSYGTIRTKQLDSNFQTKRSCYWPCKIITILLLSYTYFVSFYCADSPGGLESTIINVMDIDTTHYDMLLSVPAWPTIVLCLIGGIIVDKILGLKASYVLVIVTTAVGQVVWSLGAFLDKFLIMLVGRFFIGIGTEMTDVVIASFIAKHDFNVTISLSVLYTFARLGGALALAGPQLLYEHLSFISNSLYRLGITILFGALLMIAALVFCIIVLVMDKQQHGRTKTNNSSKMCSSLKQFSIAYWLALITICLYTPTFFSFLGVSQMFFMKKFAMKPVESGIANSLSFGSTAIISPIVGLLVNLVGYYIFWIMLGIVCALSSQILLLTDYEYAIPYIVGIINSFSYTVIIASLWTLPAILVEPNRVATAYGFIHCGYNLVMSIFTILTGLLVDHAGYFMLEIMFILIIYLAFLITIVSWMIDITRDEAMVNIPAKLMKKQ